MLQTNSYYTPIILDLNSRATIHKLSGKLSPSRRDMQALSQVSLKISLESSIHSTVHLHRPHGKEGRVESGRKHPRTYSKVGVILCAHIFPLDVKVCFQDSNLTQLWPIGRMTAGLVRLIIIKILLGIYAWRKVDSMAPTSLPGLLEILLD